MMGCGLRMASSKSRTEDCLCVFELDECKRATKLELALGKTKRLQLGRPAVQHLGGVCEHQDFGDFWQQLCRDGHGDAGY